MNSLKRKTDCTYVKADATWPVVSSAPYPGDYALGVAQEMAQMAATERLANRLFGVEIYSFTDADSHRLNDDLAKFLARIVPNGYIVI